MRDIRLVCWLTMARTEDLGSATPVDDTQKRRYVLMIPVPREAEVRIEDAYLHLAGSTKPLMGYHVTLLGPFFLADPSLSDMLPCVEKACRNAVPFELTVMRLDAFHGDGMHVVYLSVGDGDQLAALHWALVEATRGHLEMPNERVRVWNLECYEPHITLGMGLTDAELDAFVELGLVRDPELAFLGDRISLVEQAPNGLWQHIACFPLGGALDDPCRAQEAY